MAGAFLDEVVLQPESFFNQVTARTSIDGAKVFMNCNPSSPYNYFYRNVLSKLKEKNGTYIHFSMEDNLTLSDEVKQRYKTMYSGVFYRRYILGEWCVADGLIYDSFTNNNIVNPNEIPYNKIVKWCIAVDYGTLNATTYLLMGKDVDGNIYVCKQYYFSGRLEAADNNDYDPQKTDHDYEEDMRQFVVENEYLTGLTYRNIEVIIDPAAASFKAELRRYHFRVKNAKNDVLDGIRVVSTYFGNNKLFISKECQSLIQELHSYSWDTKKAQLGIDAPLKVNDHGCDALRYGIMYMKDKHKVENVGRNIGW